MQQPIHIIYISGLGDGYDSWRRRCLGWWNYRGVSVELMPMKWADGKSYEEKFERLSNAVDKAKGKRIVLIGESGGGSMAVNMYAARASDLYKVMTICGKNTGPEKVAARYYSKNPAFKTSMYQTPESIEKLTLSQRQEFMSITPLFDPTVPVRETLLSGCKHVKLFAIGHFLPIAMGLTMYSWKLVRLAR